MNEHEKESCCKKGKFLDGFSPRFSMLMHICIVLFPLFGIAGIAVENWKAGIAYFVFIIFTYRVLLIGMFCSYCPYPFKYNTCIFFPVSVFKNVKPKTGKAPFIYKFGHLIAFGGMFLIPQYWIIKNVYLSIGLWTTGLAIAVGILVHVCGRCRYQQCPFNRVPKSTLKDE